MRRRVGANLSGKRVERRESGAPGDFDWIDNASAEQLEAFINGEDKVQ
jgi:hypothetical protein